MQTLLKPTETIHILIVDDTPDTLRLLVKILESNHYTVRKALNGKMALQGAYRNPPDLILLDVNMPEINGYEVCQQLKASEATKDIPVIFISALSQTNDKVRAFEMGGHDYITKPFQELEVLTRVKHQLLLQQQRQQLEQEVQARQAAETKVRQLNATLEWQVQARTLELRKALEFEATLKRISDKVRDSLDQHQILQTAVEALAIVLQVDCCDAVLYSPDHQSSIVRYQALAPGLTVTQGQLLSMADAPEIYDQLQNQQSCLAFCQMQPLKIRNDSATLACPIFDEQVDQMGLLGDLWIFKDKASSFSEMEIHLVQQVANQCAIALRQARLYEAAQAQVKALERLNQLKDDFLCTISHELRTPISNMKMATQMLEISVNRLSLLDDETNAMHRYVNILQAEGQRELTLINNLLDLARLDADTEPLTLTTIALQFYIPHLSESLLERTQQQQQRLVFDLPDDLPPLTTDLPYLERILTELLYNAYKYTPAGETITVSAHATAETLELCVSNSGVEIPLEEYDRIFDKFYRIPNNDPWKHSGTGLGLALVKKLVAQLDAQIQVKSGDGQTTFKLMFKRAPQS